MRFFSKAIFVLVAAAASAHGAEAAERLREFHLPNQRREDALIALAQQADLSLGFAPGARCVGMAALEGRMSVDVALDRLLEGSGCSHRRIDARTVVIVPVKPSRREAVPAPPSPDPAPSPVQLSEVVITAEKRDELLSSSASGLTAITGVELARNDVADARDLSLLAAGVTVTNLGPGRNKILLRGLSDGPLTGHTQSTVGIYLGEMRLTYNAPDPDLPFIDIARIEVLRGPQGSLYGSGSIGGVVHVVPVAPDLAARSGAVGGSVSSTMHGAASNEERLILNQPLFGHQAAVRLVAWSDTSGGYIDDPVRDRVNIDRSRRKGLRLAGLWRPRESLTLEATFIHQGIATRDAHYAEPVVGALARSTFVPEPHDNDFTALTLSAHWSPGWGRLTATVSALDHDVVNTYDAALAPATLFTRGVRPIDFKDENEIRGVVAETRLTSYGPGRLQWIVGAFGASGHQSLIGHLRTLDGEGGYREQREDHLVEAAMFGELSYDLTSRTTVTVGGRVFGSSLNTDARTTLSSATSAFHARTSHHGFAPKLRLAFRPKAAVTLYVAAAEGYRTAGFNTAQPPGSAFGDAGTGGLQPLRRYAGDELWSYEAGARWRSADERFSLRMAVAQARWRDVQADLLLPSGLSYTANLGDGRTRTFELEAAYAAGPFRLASNVVKQDSDITRVAGGLSGRLDRPLSNTPEIAFAFSGAYAVPITEVWQAELVASYTYVGRSHLTVDGITAAAMGGYGDVRVGASLKSGTALFGVSVDNLLNSSGDTLAFGNPFSLSAWRQATPQRPRTVRLRLERSF